MPPSISVIIPTYNGAATLSEALASIAVQSVAPREIIVVDDASTDDIPALVERFTSAASIPVRYHRLPSNTGTPATPLNVGIEMARGDVIALLDQDDLMASDKLGRQFETLVCSSVDLVLSDYQHATLEGTTLWNSAGEIYGTAYSEMIASPGSPNILDPATARRHFLLESGIPSSCSNQMFRKRLWERHCGFDPSQGVVADYDFILRALDRPVAWIDRPLFIKRRHEHNLWQNTVANQIATLRVQRRIYQRCGRPRELARILAANTRALARRLRRERLYAKALSESMYLASLPDFRGLVAELTRTPLAYLRDHLQPVV